MSAALSLADVMTLSRALATLNAAGSSHANDLADLVNRLTARHACCDCGAWFEAPRGQLDPYERCQWCDEARETETRERGEAAAERHEDVDRVTCGGYPR